MCIEQNHTPTRGLETVSILHSHCKSLRGKSCLDTNLRSFEMPINSRHLFELVVVVVFWMTMRINNFCRGVDEVPECVVVIRAGSFIVPSLDDMGEVDVLE